MTAEPEKPLFRDAGLLLLFFVGFLIMVNTGLYAVYAVVALCAVALGYLIILYRRRKASHKTDTPPPDSP